MYEKYWLLTKKPFENTPDPRFVCWSRQHEEALSRLLYVIQERKCAAMVSGEYGSGKTLLSRILLSKLTADKYQTALLLNPRLSPTQLIQEIINQLGGKVSPSAPKAVVINKLNELLIEINRQNKYAIILVDEAQAIERRANFEEFRLLLNFQLNESFLLTLILFGQPELRKKIQELPQFEQRLALKFHLRGLDLAETKEYIKHRLEVAGAEVEIFAEPAVAAIHAYAKGLPRTINNICDLALLSGFGDNARIVDLGLAKKVIADLSGQEEPIEEPANTLVGSAT